MSKRNKREKSIAEYDVGPQQGAAHKPKVRQPHIAAEARLSRQESASLVRGLRPRFQRLALGLRAGQALPSDLLPQHKASK